MNLKHGTRFHAVNGMQIRRWIGLTVPRSHDARLEFVGHFRVPVVEAALVAVPLSIHDHVHGLGLVDGRDPLGGVVPIL
jgi:hypothetical protein